MAKKPTYEELERRVKELENEVFERMKAEETVRESVKRYRTLLRSTSDAVLMLDVERRIVSCNRSFRHLFGYGGAEVAGESIRIIHQSDESFHALGERLYPIIEKTGTGRTEWELMRKDGSTFPVETVTSALNSSDGSTIGYVAIIRDMTERHRAEKALRDSEAQKKAILDASIDNIRYVDKDMEIIWANKTMAKKLGMPQEDLVGRVCHKLLFGRDTPCEGCPTVKARETGRPERAVMYHPRIRGIEGESYWDNYTVPLKNRDGDSFIQIARDITDQKWAEKHVHILTQQLLKAQENERQKISRELHDRIGQDLSTLKISWDTLLDNQPKVPRETKHQISKLSETLQEIIATVRDLAYDLRPPGLDQAGIVQAIFQYCEDFSKKTVLNIDFTSAGMDRLRPGFDTDINLYRLVQEGLMNILKHAEAGHVNIRLVASHPNIILRMEDDGKGFDVRERFVTALAEKRMGLRSMEERVSLLKGKMDIQSSPGKGTKILIEVPYGEKKSESQAKNIDH